ncbi:MULTISPECIES: hypothetical protein [Nocardia]|uniref:hypothetical protein n=1 Tax=Nocardia abscessus TaxID=120957 RepID=UPI0018934B94|nr:hypothetical protein [Nocardia abscessus]
MTSGPDRIHAEFSGISTRSWEHPTDRTTLVTLRSLTGFDVVLRTYRANFDQPEDPLIRTVRTLGRDGGAAASPSHMRSVKGGSATGGRRELTFSG